MSGQSNTFYRVAARKATQDPRYPATSESNLSHPENETFTSPVRSVRESSTASFLHRSADSPFSPQIHAIEAKPRPGLTPGPKKNSLADALRGLGGKEEDEEATQEFRPYDYDKDSSFSAMKHHVMARTHVETPTTERLNKQLMSILDSPEHQLYEYANTSTAGHSLIHSVEEEQRVSHFPHTSHNPYSTTYSTYITHSTQEDEEQRMAEPRERELRGLRLFSEVDTHAPAPPPLALLSQHPQDIPLTRSWPVNAPSHTLTHPLTHTQTYSHIPPRTQFSHTNHTHSYHSSAHTLTHDAPSLSLPPRSVSSSHTQRYSESDDPPLRPHISPTEPSLPTHHTRRTHTHSLSHSGSGAPSRTTHQHHTSHSLSHSLTHSTHAPHSRERDSHDSAAPLLLSLESLRVSTESHTTLSLNRSSQHPLSSNKHDLIESPRSKNAFKQFMSRLKPLAKKPFLEIEAFVLREITDLPHKVRWRALVELAELAKKSNDVDKARECYIKACAEEVRGSTAWLEWSKMEEEKGRPLAALNVLAAALRLSSPAAQYSTLSAQGGAGTVGGGGSVAVSVSHNTAHHTAHNDSLLPRCVKLCERLHLFAEIAELLASLTVPYSTTSSVHTTLSHNVSSSSLTYSHNSHSSHTTQTHNAIDRCWKTLFEGALFEARVGHTHTTRALLHTLLSHIRWYGPLYLEAALLAEREDRDSEALSIIRKGLMELPRYGPLWLVHLRVSERMDIVRESRLWRVGATPRLTQLSLTCDEALSRISKELTWRVVWERCVAEERAGRIAAQGLYEQGERLSLSVCRRVSLSQCRASLATALLHCPSNLRWKLLCAGARLELSLSLSVSLSHTHSERDSERERERDRAKTLLRRALRETPHKSRALVYIECARCEELCGATQRAHTILARAADELHCDWRLCVERVLLYARHGAVSEALRCVAQSVRAHSGTGRLWALYAQILHRDEARCVRALCEENSGVSERIGSHDSLSQHTHHTHNTQHSESERALSLSPTPSSHNSLSQHTQRDIARDALLSFLLYDESESVLYAVQQREKTRASSLCEIVVRRALCEVPKSGEVWCERARCVANPLCEALYDLCAAQSALSHAMRFTPQFGDSFCESVRLELLCDVVVRYLCERVLCLSYERFVCVTMSDDCEADCVVSATRRLRERDSGASHNALTQHAVVEELTPTQRSQRRHTMLAVLRAQCVLEKRLEPDRVVEMPQLLRRCINADPNYGAVWFHCRSHAHEVASHTLRTAQRVMRAEIESARLLYLRATLLYMHRVCCTARHTRSSHITASALGVSERALAALREDLDHCVGLYTRAESPTVRESAVLFETEGEVFCVSDFATGVMQLNRAMYNRHNDEETWRHVLYSSDPIVS